MRPRLDQPIRQGSLIPDPPSVGLAAFPWTTALEGGWEEIRDETLRAGAGRGIPASRDLSPDDGRIAAGR